MGNFYKKAAFGSLMFLLSAGADASLQPDAPATSTDEKKIEKTEIVAEPYDVVSKSENPLEELKSFFPKKAGSTTVYDKRTNKPYLVVENNIEAFIETLRTVQNEKNGKALSAIGDFTKTEYKTGVFGVGGNASEVVMSAMESALYGTNLFKINALEEMCVAMDHNRHAQLLEYGIDDKAIAAWINAKSAFDKKLIMYDCLRLQETAKKRARMLHFLGKVNTNRNNLSSLVEATTPEAFDTSCRNFQTQELADYYEEWTSFLLFCCLKKCKAETVLLD